MSDTIAAISTAAGNSAVSIIRISGDGAIKVADVLFSKNDGKLADAESHKMYLGNLNTGEVRDKCFAVVFRAPKSYTGEDVAELHCHGGFRLAESVLGACVKAGARLADKGEFTKRAFLNGKLSLSDAEGVIDMINAESRAQLNAAYRQMTGGLATEVLSITADLEYLIAQLEASMDFPEEMEDEAKRDALIILSTASEKVNSLKDSYKSGKTIKNGLKIALVGEPNVGKSSLMNALLKKERAIVTDIAGTTRDTIEEKLEIDGFSVILTDTAGIRESGDCVEKIGVERAKNAAKNADFVLFLADSSTALDENSPVFEGFFENNALLSGQKRVDFDEKSGDFDAKNEDFAIVFNKCDLGIAEENRGKGIFISAKTSEGLNELLSMISEKLKQLCGDQSAEIVTSTRHFEALTKASESLTAAATGLESLPSECVVIEVREAYNQLGKITGETADENIIDAIFEKFCLGK